MPKNGRLTVSVVNQKVEDFKELVNEKIKNIESDIKEIKKFLNNDVKHAIQKIYWILGLLWGLSFAVQIYSLLIKILK